MNATSRFVYVLWREDGCHKIGVTHDPIKRKMTLAAVVAQNTDMVALWPMAEGDAFRVEKEAHALLADRAVGGEWFRVGERTACDAVLDAIAIKGPSRSMTWEQFYAAECAEWGKEAVDANLARMNAEWDAYWLARGSTHCGLDL